MTVCEGFVCLTESDEMSGYVYLAGKPVCGRYFTLDENETVDDVCRNRGFSGAQIAYPLSE